jgi:hypothetical protein
VDAMVQKLTIAMKNSAEGRRTTLVAFGPVAPAGCFGPAALSLRI